MKSPPPKKPRPVQDPDLQSLLEAILADDRTTAAKLLKKNPTLSTATVPQPKLYESPFIHWLYANDTALHLAAAGHRLAIIKLLLAAGAVPNAAANHRRSRPLHYAADGFQSPSFNPTLQVKTIRALLEAGADLHATDKKGATALHRAVRTRSAAAVDCLLGAGADPTAKNLPGSTPFHLAVQNTGRGGTAESAAKSAQRRIIESMLAHKVNPKVKDARGKSILDWASSPAIKELLSIR